MAEPECEYTCSTNVHDDLITQQSGYSPDVDFPVPHLGLRYATAQHNSNAAFDDTLAETRSAPSGGYSSLEVATEHYTLSRSRSGDNLNCGTYSYRPTQSLVVHRHDASADTPHAANSDPMNDIDEAMYQRFTLSHVPSWGDTTYHDVSTIETLVDEELMEREEKASYDKDEPLSAPKIEEHASHPLKHEIATKIFHLFDPSQFPTRGDDAPGTHLQEDLQSVQSTCPFCGSDFTGPDHKQKSIDHIQAAHLIDRSISTAVKGVDRYPMRLPKLPGLAVTKKNITALQSGRPRARVVAVCPMHHRLQLPDNLTAIGTKWQDELHAQRRATRHLPGSKGNTQGNLQQDRKTLLHMIVALVNGSDNGVNPEKINDLFNGLDLVIEDLLHRRPKNATIRGIAETFRTLRHEAGPDETLDSCHAASRRIAARTGFNSCPKSQHTDSSPSSGSGVFSASDGQASKRFAQGNTPSNWPSPAEGPSGPVPATFVNGKNKKSRNRHLACPFTKYDEVHGRPPTCRFTGAANMSALRAHLTSGEHLTFMTYCHPCANYVYDRNEWEAQHQHVGRSNKQTRGPGVVNQWRGMFKKLFPDSEWIPHPYIGNRERIANDALLHRQDIHGTAMDHDHGFNFNDPPARPAPRIENGLASSDVAATMHNNFSGHTNMLVHDTHIPGEETVLDEGEGHYHFSGSLPRTNQSFLDQTMVAADTLPPASSPMPYALGMYLNNTQSRSTRSELSHDLNRSSSVYPEFIRYQWPDRSSLPPRTTYDPPNAEPGHSQRQGDVIDHTGTATLSQIVDLLRCCAHALGTGDSASLTQMIIEAHSADPRQLASMGDALVTLIEQTEQRQRRAASYIQQPADLTMNPQEVESAPIARDRNQLSDPILFQDQPLRSLESWEDEIVAPVVMGENQDWIPPSDYPPTIFPDISVSIG